MVNVQYPVDLPVLILPNEKNSVVRYADEHGGESSSLETIDLLFDMRVYVFYL